MITNDLIVEQLGRIVGHGAIAPYDRKEHGLYHAIMGLEDPARTPPAAIVTPGTVKQIQSLVKIAGTFDVGISVIPNNAGNGASLCSPSKNNVVVNLNSLDSIVELDTDSGFALVEPGVSFSALHNALAQNDSAYWIDADDNGANSVVGSIFERGNGYSPYGDHLLMQCGMELVTSSGDVTRTGMGALPGNNTWQLFKYNYGPYLDGLFSRSGLGVLTKVGIWLMPAPPSYFPFMVTIPDRATLAAAVELMRPLKIGMVVPNTIVAAHRSADDALVKMAGGTPSAAEHEWTLYGALYGLPANVDLTWSSISNALESLTGAAVYTQASPLANFSPWPIRMQMMRGLPAFNDTAHLADRSLKLSVAAPIEGEAVTDMLNDVDTIVEQNDGSSIDFALGWRTLFMRLVVPYESGQLMRQRDKTLALVERLNESGYAVSHDSPALSAVVNTAQLAPEMQQLQSSLRQALDPRGVFGAPSV